MMPVLQAREALHQADVLAWGSGNLKKSDAATYRSKLQRLARSPGARERGPGLAQLPPEQAKLALAAYGIGYVIVPPPSQSRSSNGDLAEDAE